MSNIKKALNRIWIGLLAASCLIFTGCEPMKYDEGAGPELANVTWFDLFLRISGAVWVAVFIICFIIVLVLIKKNKIDVSKLGERPDDYYEKKYGESSTKEHEEEQITTEE